MSDTPLTDNESEHAENVALYLTCDDKTKWSHGPIVVRADFARDLERKLNASQAENAELKASIKQIAEQWKSCSDKLLLLAETLNPESK